MALVLMTSAVLYKWNQQRQKPQNSLNSKKVQAPFSTSADIMAKREKLYPPKRIKKEEIEQRYEQVKFERLITAMRGHHSRDLERIVAEGVDFSMLPENAKDRLQQVAKEEDFQTLISPLF